MAYDYEGQCGSCENLKSMESDYILFDGGYYTDGHCTELRTIRRPYFERCDYYYKNRYGCHIVTALTKLVGAPEKGGTLDVYRSFRANVLEKDSEYKEVLSQYDIVGPQIAKCLVEDYKDGKDKEMIIGLYDHIVCNIAKKMEDNPQLDKNTKEKNKLEAIKEYTEFTKSLMDYYGIKEISNNTKDNNCVKKLGTIGGNLYE